MKLITNLKKPSSGKKLQFKEEDTGFSDSHSSSGSSISSKSSNHSTTSSPLPKSFSKKKSKQPAIKTITLLPLKNPQQPLQNCQQGARISRPTLAIQSLSTSIFGLIMNLI
jgi:hypothetical protein